MRLSSEALLPMSLALLLIFFEELRLPVRLLIRSRHCETLYRRVLILPVATSRITSLREQSA